MIDTPIFFFYIETMHNLLFFSGTIEVGRATYRLVMDFTHFCS